MATGNTKIQGSGLSADCEIGSLLKVKNSANMVGIGTMAPSAILHVQGPSGQGNANKARIVVSEKYNDSATDFGIDFKRTYDTGGDNQDAGYIHVIRDGGASNAGMAFGIGNRVDSDREKMRIDSSGRLMVGTTTEGHTDADDLTIASTGSTGLTIRSGDDDWGSIYFSDATTGNAEHSGYIDYSHTDDLMRFGTNQGTKVWLDSAGRAGIGTIPANFGSNVKSLEVHSQSATLSYFALTNSTTGQGGVTNGFNFFADGNNAGVWNREDGHIRFGTNGVRRMCIENGATVAFGAENTGDNAENTIEIYTGGTNEAYARIRGKYNATNEYNRSEVRFGVENNATGKGFLAFATGTNTAQERMRILSNGNVKINDGNLIIGDAGHGIDFSATSDSGTVVSETLDDYEEGKWTPTITCGSQNPAYTILNSGTANWSYYIKIGRLVHFNVDMNISMTDVGSGNVNVSIPFQVDNTSGNKMEHYVGGIAGRAQSVLNLSRQEIGWYYHGSVMSLYHQNESAYGESGAITNADLRTGSNRLTLSGWYYAAS